MKTIKAWRLIGLMTCALLLTGCSIDDGDSASEEYPMDDRGLSMRDEFNGEFAINWMVDGEVVDTTRLQVAQGATVLSMPFDWLHQQIFQKTDASIEIRDDEISKMCGLWLRLTGYTDSNVYFNITRSTYTQRVFVDDHSFEYYVYFSTDKATAIYSKQWDSWAATIPIDSIQVTDDSIRVNHRPAVVDVIRFNPARILSFISTKRTKNWEIGD